MSKTIRTSNNLTIDAAGDVIIDADNADIKLQDGGTEFGRISRVTSDLVVKSMGTNNDILFNEIAPRPHNSGHITRESHLLSQFGLLGKIICDERVENPEAISTALMKNLLGEFFINKDHEKIISKMNKNSNYFIKMYNKNEAKIGRKMGHITVITKDIEKTIIKINQLID